MSPTLLEGAIAILLVWIAWRIGVMLSPWVVYKLTRRGPRKPGEKKPPSKIIDV
jgi:hypothetical protein